MEGGGWWEHRRLGAREAGPVEGKTYNWRRLMRGLFWMTITYLLFSAAIIYSMGTEEVWGTSDLGG